MQESEIIQMQEAEQNYWWHISRRFILQSILCRFLNCHAEFISVSQNKILKRAQDDISHCHSDSTRQAQDKLRGGIPLRQMADYNKTDPSTPLRSAQDDMRGIRSAQDDISHVIPAPFGLELMAERQAGIQTEKQTKTISKNYSLNILDVGCGTGINLEWLKNFGNVVGIDSNEEAIKFCEKHGKAILSNAVELPVENKSQDLITAFDVLEHLEDDKKALHEWHRVLKHNGYLFLSVPAYQWLFSNRDKQLGHYRRYNLYNLLKLLRRTGFEVVFNSHIFALVFPLFILQRIFFQKKTTPVYPKLSPILNNFLELISHFEIQLLKFMRFPFGGSIVILVKKS